MAYLIVIVVEPATLKKRLLLLIDWRQKLTLFSTSLIIISLKTFCIYYIPQDYVIQQAMPHAIPQTHSSFYPPRL